MSSISVDVTTDELELIEEACRALDERYRRDAEANAGHSVRHIFLDSRERFIRLAERMKEARTAAPSNVRELKPR